MELGGWTLEARRILKEHPDQAIVLYSSYLDRDIIKTAENLGVRICLPKDEIRHLPDVLWATELPNARGGAA